MRKGTNKERDAELIRRLQDEAPEVLRAKVDFESIVERIVNTDTEQLLTDHAQQHKQKSNRKRH